MPKFAPDEAVEIELLLWEYDRDGSIAIDKFHSPAARTEQEDGRQHHP
jgi:hypothetical protein